MSFCVKCQSYFPNRIWLNGKQRVLNRRKYCLICSPFGERNTSKLELVKKDGHEFACGQCGRKYVYKRGRGHTHKKCNSCVVNTRRKALKRRAVEYKGGCCKNCGYNKCINALVFHHVDPTTKEFLISGNHCYSWDRIRKELDKCVLLCHNCHTEVHAGDL